MFSVVIENGVSKFLLSVQSEASTKATRLFDLLERFGPSLGMPYSKKVGKNLYELRPRGKQELRLFYCFMGRSVRIVHGFVKKTQKTPRREIEIAIRKIKGLK